MFSPLNIIEKVYHEVQLSQRLHISKKYWIHSHLLVSWRFLRPFPWEYRAQCPEERRRVVAITNRFVFRVRDWRWEFQLSFIYKRWIYWLIDQLIPVLEIEPRASCASTNPTAEPHLQPIHLFLNLLTCVFIPSQSLFWSKSKDLAHKYTWVQGKMFTLEDTLLGYIADDLRWCGDPSTSGKDLNHLEWFSMNGEGALNWTRQ